MCQTASYIITKSRKVYWKLGVNSHEKIIKLYRKDEELKDDKEPPNNTFARVEISPKNGDYLRPDKWVFKIDERKKPYWWHSSYEKLCWAEHKKWEKKMYSSFNFKEALHPIHPFKIEPPKITKKHIELLKKWDSVWDLVWDSVRNSVLDSVLDSVGAYIGSLFPNIKKWKYVKKTKDYPFQSAVDLWKMGLVPSYDGKVWRLHGGKKGKVLWEGKLTKK